MVQNYTKKPKAQNFRKNIFGNTQSYTNKERNYHNYHI